MTRPTAGARNFIIQVLHYIARSKMQNAENAREPLRPRTSPSSFMKHSSGEGASICSSQRGLVGVAQHRNAVCLFALRTWQSRRASGCSVTPESPVVQGSACGRLHCTNTSGSTNCRQRLLSLSERRHGIAIGAGLHALVPVDAGATEVSAEASRGNARCKPQALRIRCSETAVRSSPVSFAFCIFWRSILALHDLSNGTYRYLVQAGSPINRLHLCARNRPSWRPPRVAKGSQHPGRCMGLSLST